MSTRKAETMVFAATAGVADVPIPTQQMVYFEKTKEEKSAKIPLIFEILLYRIKRIFYLSMWANFF